MSKSKDAAAPAAVLAYLNKQNRPYSAIDIFNNLHKEYGKTAVVKALETMASSGKIREKTYGKQKVYVADQSQFAAVDDAELKKMDENITQLTDNYKTIQTDNKKLESELSSFQSSLTTDEAVNKVKEIKSEIVRSKERLHSLKNNNNSVSPAERKEIMKSREKYVKEWRKRKRITKDILDAILEGYPKSKKDLYEEVGIETDEDYKVTVPTL